MSQTPELLHDPLTKLRGTIPSQKSYRYDTVPRSMSYTIWLINYYVGFNEYLLSITRSWFDAWSRCAQKISRFCEQNGYVSLMCFSFFGAFTFINENKFCAFIFRQIGGLLMKKADEETDQQPCSSSRTREDVEEISISLGRQEGKLVSSCTSKAWADWDDFVLVFRIQTQRYLDFSLHRICLYS